MNLQFHFSLVLKQSFILHYPIEKLYLLLEEKAKMLCRNGNQCYQCIATHPDIVLLAQNNGIASEISASLQPNPDEDYLRPTVNQGLSTTCTSDYLELPNNQDLFPIGIDDYLQLINEDKQYKSSATTNQESDYLTVVAEVDDFQCSVGEMKYKISCSITSTS